MNVRFSKTLPEKPSSPFCLYLYQEHIAQDPSYADLRAIVQSHTQEWLNDVALSHSQLSASIIRHTPWWWLSGLSRLDARPWGYESQLKPLFFARAIIQWHSDHPGEENLLLVGCPSEVASFLRDFKPEITMSGVSHSSIQYSVGALKEWARFKWQGLKQLVCLVTKTFAPKKGLKKDAKLILFERFSPEQGFKGASDYYYAGLFESPVLKSSLTFVCLDQLSFDFKSDNQGIYLLDDIRFLDVIWVLWHQCVLGFWLWVAAFKPRECSLGGFQSKTFWRHFLLQNHSKGVIIKELSVYRVFKRWVSEGMIQSLTYPYEEKGYERALLMACQGSSVKTIGYMPHSQHRLAISMKDSFSPMPQRPLQYAACGSLYVDFFKTWALKPNPVHVWGSSKSSSGEFSDQKMSQDLNVLLMLSHPNELNVFASWLKAEAALQKDVTYWVRSYKSVPEKVFKERFGQIQTEFSMVKEAVPDFDQSLTNCDVVIFNATSAGLLAINRGKLAIHVALDDFFAINPCFDQLETMLHCPTSKAFSKRLSSLRQMEASQVQALWQDQKKFVAQIFSAIDPNRIEGDLNP